MNANYICPALTYMNADGSLDQRAQASVFDWILDAGIDGMLIGGSSSEFSAMTEKQREEMLSFSISYLKGKTNVIAGCASISTAKTIALSNDALALGASSVMILPPYYFRLSQDRLFEYYASVLPHIKGDVYFYNYPDATGHSLAAETILKLVRQFPNLRGLKDTIPGMSHTREVLTTLLKEFPDFEVYSGFDDNFAHNLLSGGRGCMGGMSNILPKLCIEWRDAFRQDDFAEIARLQRCFNDLMELYTLGNSFPAAFKEIVKLQGLPVQTCCTTPLDGVSEADRERIAYILKEHHLI